MLRIPKSDPPVESTDHLRRLAQLRREQGYDVQEILRKFDILEEIVYEEVASWLDRNGSSPGDAISALGVVRRSLSRFGILTVGTYQEAHLREKREVSGMSYPPATSTS